MEEIIFIAVLVVLSVFGFVVFVGAPYVPVLSPQKEEAFRLLNLKPGQHLLELGCGDGRVLVAAAERGIRATGYEINPVLALISWLRTRKYGGSVTVIWGNYWNKDWPAADGIFVFLLDKYMQKLDKKIILTYPGKKIKIVSFAFKIPNREIKKEKLGLFLYQY